MTHRHTVIRTGKDWTLAQPKRTGSFPKLHLIPARSSDGATLCGLDTRQGWITESLVCFSFADDCQKCSRKYRQAAEWASQQEEAKP